jgi:hypothetical protein
MPDTDQYNSEEDAGLEEFIRKRKMEYTNDFDHFYGQGAYGRLNYVQGKIFDQPGGGGYNIIDLPLVEDELGDKCLKCNYRIRATVHSPLWMNFEDLLNAVYRKGCFDSMILCGSLDTYVRRYSEKGYMKDYTFFDFPILDERAVNRAQAISIIYMIPDMIVGRRELLDRICNFFSGTASTFLVPADIPGMLKLSLEGVPGVEDGSGIRVTNEDPPRIFGFDLIYAVSYGKDKKYRCSFINSVKDFYLREGVKCFVYPKVLGTSICKAISYEGVVELMGTLEPPFRNPSEVLECIDEFTSRMGSLFNSLLDLERLNRQNIEFEKLDEPPTPPPPKPSVLVSDRRKRQKLDSSPKLSPQKWKNVDIGDCLQSKEGKISEILQKMVEKGTIPPFTRNKKILTGQIRPDFRWCTGKAIVVLECDEHQHKKYNRDGEAMREVRMVQECGDLPLILIRYNPDGLVTLNASGPSGGVLMRGTRIDTLASIVSDIICKSQKSRPSEPITYYKLFYDCECADTDGCNFTHVECFKTPEDLLERRISLSEIRWGQEASEAKKNKKK